MSGGGSPKTQHHRDTAAFRRVAAALAQQVRALRKERGWTVEAAAERMHVEPAHVRRIERGTANPSLAVLVSIAAAFGTDMGQLLSESSPPPPAG